MSIEIKDFGFECKATGDNIFEGYASIFGNKDSHDDIIEPGSFTKTLQESKRVKVLWQHNPNIPIGKPIAMSEDSKGLHIKAKISQTEYGKDAMILIKDGVIDELSIGYNTVKADWDSKSGARRIKEVRLWEFSPVTFASNDQANIAGTKSMLDQVNQLNAWINGEMKAGSMLSAKNKGLVEQAITSLKALLDAAEGNNGEPDNSTQQTSDDEKKAANDVMDMLKEMSAFAKNKY